MIYTKHKHCGGLKVKVVSEHYLGCTWSIYGNDGIRIEVQFVPGQFNNNTGGGA